MVLIAVALSVRTLDVRVRPLSLLIAGGVSGVTGTATSIGGPPIALLYQRRPPAQIRDTLAACFLLGSMISLVALGLAGQLQWRAGAVAALLAPALLLGFTLARRLRARVRPAAVRPVLLLVRAVAALVLIARSVWG